MPANKNKENKTAATKTTAKKSASKTTATTSTVKESSPDKDKQIKYSDKSLGQPQLVPIFETIKSLMQPYAKGTIKEQTGNGGMYNLVSKKQLVVDGRKRAEMYFAGLLVQKGYVGFYFMPVYLDALKKVFKTELLKCLKGKACFHIKKEDPQIMDQIKDALKEGYRLYEEKGWVD